MTILASCRKRGTTFAASALLVSMAATGCSSSDGSDESPTPTPSAAATTDSGAADEAAVASVVDKFWAASTAAQNGPSDDPAQFAGIATGSVVESILKTARNYQEQDIRRVGGPTLGKPLVAVSGDAATAELCVDESTWGAERKGVTVPPPPDAKASATHLTLQKVDGTWLVTGTDEQAKDTVTC